MAQLQSSAPDKELSSHKFKYLNIFTIARKWKQPKCPSTDEWIEKMWDTYTVEYYSAIEKDEILLFAVT